MNMLFYANQHSEESAPFMVKPGEQITVVGMGLDSGLAIGFELLYVPSYKGDPCECPPGKAELPQVSAKAQLAIEGNRVLITEDSPFAIIDAPQNTLIRAVLIDDTNGQADTTGVVAWYTQTATPDLDHMMRGYRSAPQ